MGKEVTPGNVGKLNCTGNMKGLLLTALLTQTADNTVLPAGTRAIDWNQVVLKLYIKGSSSGSSGGGASTSMSARNIEIYNGMVAPLAAITNYGKGGYRYISGYYGITLVEPTAAVAGTLMVPIRIDIPTVTAQDGEEVVAEVTFSKGAVGAGFSTTSSTQMYISEITSDDSEGLTPVYKTVGIQGAQPNIGEGLGNNVYDVMFYNHDVFGGTAHATGGVTTPANVYYAEQILTGNVSLKSDTVSFSYMYEELLNLRNGDLKDGILDMQGNLLNTSGVFAEGTNQAIAIWYSNFYPTNIYGQSFMLHRGSRPMNNVKLDATLTAGNVNAGTNYVVTRGYNYFPGVVNNSTKTVATQQNAFKAKHGIKA